MIENCTNEILRSQGSPVIYIFNFALNLLSWVSRGFPTLQCALMDSLVSRKKHLIRFSWKTLKHRTINDISDFSHPIVKSVYAVSRRPTKWQSVAKLTPTNCAYQLQRTVYLVASSFFSRKHEMINTPGKPNHRRDIHIVTRKSLLSISNRKKWVLLHQPNLKPR